MGKSIEELKEEHERLVKEKKEREERNKLEAEIKAMKEEGTWKAKVKSALKSTREHLRKKGAQLNGAGNKHQETGFGSNIRAMAQESNFGTPAVMLQSNHKTSLYKELTEKTEKEKTKK